MPSRDAPIVLRLAGSCGPEYAIDVHEDGLVEYSGGLSVAEPGIGWKQLDPAELKRLLDWSGISVPQITDAQIAVDEKGCRAFDGRAVRASIRRGGRWVFDCWAAGTTFGDAPSTFPQEVELLRLIGALGWVTTTAKCPSN